MKFKETDIRGAFIIDPEIVEDERGFFARTFCREEFAAHQLNPDLAQCSISFNRQLGTLRGMHWQVAPHAEVKLVRCTRGSIHDVIIDLRPESGTFRQWIVVELSEHNNRMLYIPRGLAHGFMTLAEASEVFYQISEFHHPECARGVRWNDPAFGIRWPLTPVVMSHKDQSYPDFVA
jgi:dTDP-4-dehydrorhamnose 3,5-epimerase